jgi:hypothetical protein
MLLIKSISHFIHILCQVFLNKNNGILKLCFVEMCGKIESKD